MAKTHRDSVNSTTVAELDSNSVIPGLWNTRAHAPTTMPFVGEGRQREMGYREHKSLQYEAGKNRVIAFVAIGKQKPYDIFLKEK